MLIICMGGKNEKQGSHLRGELSIKSEDLR